jgi:SAM-dependent methyltransferase
VAISGDYVARGDYHRHLDPHWSYAPIYLRKLAWVDAFVGGRSKSERILDVGAGEGSLVERYRERGYDVIGIDSAYESQHVKKADILALPFDDEIFDILFCLDVLEHVELLDQAKALDEMRRVLKSDGTLLMSVPNLAHLHSRLRFLFTGKLTRTSAVERHPGDRPLSEYLGLLESRAFSIERRSGIFPTLPLVFRAVNHHPDRMGWLVGLLDKLLPFPSLCFLTTLVARKTSPTR